MRYVSPLPLLSKSGVGHMVKFPNLRPLIIVLLGLKKMVFFVSVYLGLPRTGNVFVESTNAYAIEVLYATDVE
tara:strand:+ start:498 stop:716 length:219 start_codon:yes stop_codon:yes gene_type:complete